MTDNNITWARSKGRRYVHGPYPDVSRGVTVTVTRHIGSSSTVKISAIGPSPWELGYVLGTPAGGLSERPKLVKCGFLD